MADISGLTNLQATEPLDWDGYADAQESKPIPPAGRYTLQVSPQVTFPPAKSGALQAQIDPVVVAGPEGSTPGYVLRGAKVSAKSFDRGGKKASFAADLIRAVGLPLRPSTTQEMADALEATAGQSFQADLDWEAGQRNGDFYVKGMVNFPKDATGHHIPWVTKVVGGQTVNDPVTGEPEMVRGYVRIVRFVARA